jgi:ATPase family associated with various cellular activities (AAA)
MGSRWTRDGRAIPHVDTESHEYLALSSPQINFACVLNDWGDEWLIRSPREAVIRPSLPIDWSRMSCQLHDFATRPTLIRGAIEAWRPRIEAKLGASLDDAVIIETRHNLAQIGVEALLGVEQNRVGSSKITRRLKTFLVAAEIPPGLPPFLGYSKSPAQLRYSAMFDGEAQPRRSRVEWQDCPVALKLRTITDPIVALNVFYQPGPNADSETEARPLVMSRRSVEQVIRLLETLDARDTTPTLTVFRGQRRKIIPCDWDELVLAPSVLSLLKNDFKSFWDREQWFRDRGLPFRRGYLLHGPPGGGTTTSIRAMMTSRRLSAFTIRLFEPQTSDADLEDLFEEALSQRPAMLVFEDLDRAFPRTGQSRSQVSLQALLNCLDGIATGDGIAVVATANEPAALDPAILRRPGRFDRVVHFPNPDRMLREQFFNKMKLSLSPAALKQSITNSKGFSFAQLRESVILAAQFADERNVEVDGSDLLRGVEVLRETMVRGSAFSNRAGFVPTGAEDGEAA